MPYQRKNRVLHATKNKKRSKKRKTNKTMHRDATVVMYDIVKVARTEKLDTASHVGLDEVAPDFSRRSLPFGIHLSLVRDWRRGDDDSRTLYTSQNSERVQLALRLRHKSVV